MDKNAQKYQELWSDSNNWYFKIIYFCKNDPRTFVAKRHKWMGVTLNFARGVTYLYLVIFLVIIFFLTVYGL